MKMDKNMKQDKKLSQMDLDIKKKLLEELMSQADDAMMNNLKKDTVASNSKQGLKEGLMKAEELLSKGQEHDMESEDSEENNEDEMENEEECSEEESAPSVSGSIKKMMQKKMMLNK